MAPFVVLDDAEKEFSDRLQRGELAPELLFPEDSDMAERLLRYPPLLWKAHNARESSKKTK